MSPTKKMILPRCDKANQWASCLTYLENPSETVDNNYLICLATVGQFLKSFTHKKVLGLLGVWQPNKG